MSAIKQIHQQTHEFLEDVILASVHRTPIWQLNSLDLHHPSQGIHDSNRVPWKIRRRHEISSISVGAQINQQIWMHDSQYTMELDFRINLQEDNGDKRRINLNLGFQIMFPKRLMSQIYDQIKSNQKKEGGATMFTGEIFKFYVLLP